MPIKTRIDMLSTGIKTPVGIKLSGPDLAVLQALGARIEAVLRELPETSSVYAERVDSGNYLDIVIDRDQIARYGLTIRDVEDVIAAGIGGVQVLETVEGLERYAVNVRYSRELRDDPTSLRRVLVTTGSGAQIPLGQLARFEFTTGPPMIKTENARPHALLSIDLGDVDAGTWVEHASEVLAREVMLPSGVLLEWTGDYVRLQSASQRLALIAPVTLGLIFLLLYLNFRRADNVFMILACLPAALSGGVLLLLALDYDLSVAVFAGFLALAGLSAETGVIMLLFLEHAKEQWTREGRIESREDLVSAVISGASARARPLLMTVASDVIGLLPIMWGVGTGSETMRRIAAPMVGGVVTTTLATLFLLPVLYAWVGGRRLPKRAQQGEPPQGS